MQSRPVVVRDVAPDSPVELLIAAELMTMHDIGFHAVEEALHVSIVGGSNQILGRGCAGHD